MNQKPRATAKTVERLNKHFETYKNLPEGEEKDRAYQKYLRYYDDHNWDDYTVVKDGKEGLYNHLGEVLVPPVYAHLIWYRTRSKKGVRIVAIDENDKMALITVDGEGTPVTGFDYDSIKPVNVGFMDYWVVYKDGKCGIIDEEGNTVLPIEMDDIDYLYNCLDDSDMYTDAVVVLIKDGKYGLMLQDNTVIPPVYDEIPEVVYDDDVDYLGFYDEKVRDYSLIARDGSLVPPEKTDGNDNLVKLVERGNYIREFLPCMSDGSILVEY